MRLIDADAFAVALKRISEKQGYSELYMNVDDVLNAVIDDLQGKALYGYENCPTVEAIPRERIEQMVAEILMKDMDRTICGEEPLTATDCATIIRKYTKENNND